MTTTAPVSEYTRTLLAAVDGLDAEAYTGHLTDDVRLQFGNGDPLVGREAVMAMLEGHFATIERMRHEVLAEFRDGDALIQQLNVTMVRKNGNRGTVPAVNVLRLRDGKAYDYRVYIDLSPVDGGAAEAH